MKIVFASNNSGKIAEIKNILPSSYTLLSLSDINFTDEIAETGNTFQQNAWIKAETIWKFCKMPCIADDSGLCIETLNGKPGVYSARFAGEPSNANLNIDKVLHEMKGVQNRNAAFITCICYYDGLNAHYFEGKIEGKITTEKKGENGFGYDPIFIPEGKNQTFAELKAEEKNKISHRKIALHKWMEFIK